MLADSFWANFVIFVAGQAAAWGYLATGRVTRGVLLVVGGFVLADLALVSRLVAPTEPWLHLGSLTAMQAWSVFELGAFVLGRSRRRLPRRLAERAARHRLAFVHYLRDELVPAQAIWAKLRWRDPWDLEVTIALATVSARLGANRRARRLLRAARALDRHGRWRDVIAAELRRSTGARRPRSRSEPAPAAARELQAQGADES